jgi:ankyrin repeat protein
LYCNRMILLNLASNSRYVDIVKLLLEKGANITVANINKVTLLNSASNSRYVNIVKLLLEKRADVTASGNPSSRTTALHSSG